MSNPIIGNKTYEEDKTVNPSNILHREPVICDFGNFADPNVCGPSTIIISTPVTPSYNVTFDLAGGVRIGGGELVQTVLSGGNATLPTITPPTGKTFKSWSGSYLNITSNRTITATYNTPVITYHVKFGSHLSPLMSEQVFNELQNEKNISSRKTTYLCDASNYKWICISKELGQANIDYDFLDETTKIPVAMNDMVEFGNYYCYRTYNKMGGSITIRIL